MPTTDYNTMDPRELEAMDAPLIALASRSGGDLRKLLHAFFSFLHRRTDFYIVHSHSEDDVENSKKMGFAPGQAEKMLLAAFRQFPLRKMPRQADMVKATKKSETPSSSAKPTANKNKSSSQNDKPSSSAPASNEKDKDTKTTKTTTTTTVRYTDDGLQVPVGNGGTTARYTWTQTLDECSVLVPTGPDRRAKDLDVTIRPTSIAVRSADGSVVLVDGPLTERIVPSESTWSLEGGVLVLVLYKHQKTFWEAVLEGDEKIDTSQVDSRRHIGEYDESTQAQLRKMIYDQSQSRKGLPTSDEVLMPPMPPPSLPAGVEYIDQKKLDEHAKSKGGG